MEDIVHAVHHAAAALQRAHVADIELDLMRDFGITHLILMAHIVLLLLVARENTDFLNIGVQKPAQNRVAETTGSSSYKKSFVFEY